MVKFFSLFIFIAILSSCSSNEKKSKEQAYYHLKIGTSHLKNKNYPAALSSLLEANRLDKMNPLIYNNLGLAYFVREKYKISEKNILKALSLDPKYTDARINLGALYIHTKRYNLAIKTLKIATEDLTYGIPEKSYTNLGIAYFKSKQYEKAKYYFKKSLKLRQNSCQTFNYYGRSLYELKMYEQSAPSFDRAEILCQRQKFEEPKFYGALSYLKIGKRELAVTKLREVVRNYPQSSFAKRANKLLKLLNKASL